MFCTVIAVGSLGRDPELRYTPSGTAVCNFSIACNRQYANSNGEQVKETLWLRISTFGKQAESCNTYLKKGSKVLVEGRLTPDKATGNPRIWESNGKTGSSYDVTASTVRFLSSRSEGGAVEAAHEAEAPAEDLDMPF